MERLQLFVIPSVPVWKYENFLVFDRKFYDGMSLYAQMWPGDVTCIMSAAIAELPSFGLVSQKQDELPFRCLVLSSHEQIREEHLSGASVVLASGDSCNQFDVSRLCKKVSAKCVYIIEYTPETRYQIAALSTKNSLVKLYRYLYIWKSEMKRQSAFSIADALQINGMAAYYEYHRSEKDLLYFDTRVDRKNMIGDEELDSRLAYLARNEPLRLAFSGRLIRMKGADHLISIAALLKQQGIKFVMTIYGAGDLESEMRDRITQCGLEDVINMPGAVDFYEELIPALHQKTDLFIMPHMQSDPACTYLETLSCGVPIIGYRNQAFSGLLERSDMGWGVEMGDLSGVVKAVKHLNTHRQEIAEKARNSIRFARHHTFEKTFKSRIDHLHSLCTSRQPSNFQGAVRSNQSVIQSAVK
ncbi:MAG: hypothetical protein Fur0046_12680 [Cyanobacteria bacterium J069]|nr:MAG: glycosyltransferase family 1 protein [Cyanobacteria bacterium J069]